MNIEKLLVIPQKESLTEFVGLSRKYGLGFEYNDFFLPAVLDDEAELERRIELYNMEDNKPAFSTMHGAFLDITVFSDDERIQAVSDFRVTQSLKIAKRLGAKGVVFHTNYITNFELDSYRDGWVDKNAAYWSRKLLEFPELNIYIENMFDVDCELLLRLAEKMKDHKNFGICLDYAHAQVFGDEKKIEEWVSRLSPYVRHIHINDNDFKRDLHLPLGDGKIDWSRFKYFYQTYFKGSSVLIEVTGIDKAKKSIEYLKNL